MFCSKVKEFLSQKGVNFIERDISQDENALTELKKLGIMTTPVTTIDGEMVVGFDQQKLEQLLGD
jgi:glutaredoxin